MHAMHIGELDLNLLRVLDVLLAERSVTRAAHKLGLSQSATSHALARLRDALGDPLLIREKRGLVLSARAEELKAPLARAFGLLETAVATPPPFDPKTSERTFRIMAADYAELVLLPELMKEVAKQAPRVNLWLVPWRIPDDDPDLDAVIGVNPEEFGPGLRSRAIVRERFISATRTGHPESRKRWTPESFANMDHAFIAPQGTPGGVVDTMLAKRKLKRRVALGVPHFLAAPFVVAETDLVITLPLRIAETLARSLSLELREPPIEIPGFTVFLMWRERLQRDPAHIWLRELIARVAERVEASSGKEARHGALTRSSPWRERRIRTR